MISFKNLKKGFAFKTSESLIPAVSNNIDPDSASEWAKERGNFLTYDRQLLEVCERGHRRSRRKTLWGNFWKLLMARITCWVAEKRQGLGFLEDRAEWFNHFFSFFFGICYLLTFILLIKSKILKFHFERKYVSLRKFRWESDGNIVQTVREWIRDM